MIALEVVKPNVHHVLEIAIKIADRVAEKNAMEHALVNVMHVKDVPVHV